MGIIIEIKNKIQNKHRNLKNGFFMKTNKSSFQLFFLVVVLFITSVYISAQDATKIRKFSFKLGYSKYKDTEFTFYSISHKNDMTLLNEVSNIRLSANYRLTNFIEVGAFWGYSLYKTMIPFDIDSLGRPNGYSSENSNSLMYGINSNIHILPFFIEKDKSRIDVYCSLQYGGIYLFEPEGGINTKKNYSEYGLYGGLAFYPFRHLGIYAEFGYAKYADLRYGLSLQF
jgi:hypothetical protein